jgi:hypothetical protein
MHMKLWHQTHYWDERTSNLKPASNRIAVNETAVRDQSELSTKQFSLFYDSAALTAVNPYSKDPNPTAQRAGFETIDRPPRPMLATKSDPSTEKNLSPSIATKQLTAVNA